MNTLNCHLVGLVAWENDLGFRRSTFCLSHPLFLIIEPRKSSERGLANEFTSLDFSTSRSKACKDILLVNPVCGDVVEP